MMYKSVRQYESADCASACIASLSWYYGKKVSLTALQHYINMDKSGSSIFHMIKACKKIGLNANAEKKLENFNINTISTPCIAHVFLEDGTGHYLVIYKIRKEKIVISDPAIGLISINKKDFVNSVFSEKTPYIWSGILIFVNPDKDFKKIIITEKNSSGFLKLLFIEKKMVVQLLILSVFSMIFNMLNAFYYKILLDIIIPNMWINSLILITLLFIIFNIINILINKQKVKKALEISKSITMKLSLDYYKKILKLPIKFLNARKNGEFISRFQDANKVQEILVTSILILPIDIMLISIVGIILGLKSINLLILVLLMCSGYLLIATIFKRFYITHNAKQMIAHATMTSYFVDSLEGIETIKIYCQENTTYESGKQKFFKWQSAVIKLANVENNQTALKTAITNLGKLIIICVAAIETIYGNITVGDLITYNILIGYLLAPINDIISIQPQFHAAQVAMERLNIIMQSVSEAESGQKLKCLNQVVFDNIDFSYNAEQKILRGISLKISKGQKVAIIGSNGSGKTTIAKLLIKFYSGNNGNLYFNNNSITTIEKNSIRRNIIYVSQEDFILSGSIKENLKFGDENISDEQMILIAKALGVHDFVKCLPQLYESILEERGANLSKGQKQKIAVARAVLHEPQMLILDEATCSMDISGENKIMNYLKGNKDLGLIVIAHRLNKLEDFDCIYIMNEGKIVAQGKHAELLKSFSQYKNYIKI